MYQMLFAVCTVLLFGGSVFDDRSGSDAGQFLPFYGHVQSADCIVINGNKMKIEKTVTNADQGDVAGYYIDLAARQGAELIDRHKSVRVAALLLSGFGVEPGDSFDHVFFRQKDKITMIVAKNTGRGTVVLSGQADISMKPGKGWHDDGLGKPDFAEKYMSMKVCGSGSFANFYTVSRRFGGDVMRQWIDYAEKNGWQCAIRGRGAFISKGTKNYFASFSEDNRMIIIFG